ncbi:MAG: cytochrome c maturation protein CcmE [Chloroflexi bacterium]|nr:cytochrome c maturation protein CcmE [Chloroflexota bacterium]
MADHQDTATTGVRGVWSSRNIKFALAGALVLAAIAFLTFMMTRGASSFFAGVSEVLAQGPTEQQVRVKGKVLVASIRQDPAKNEMRFEMTDGSRSMPVLYYGGVTNQFYRTDADVVVEGRLGTDGVFRADNLISRHASELVADK